MDSLTQIVLGAACGEAVLGKKIGNKALLFGAIGGTIPDLDVFIGRLLYANEIEIMAFHRGFMHSILFSILASIILGWVVFKLYDTGRRLNTTKKKDWIWLFFLALFTHPILDAFTPYGTQLFAPFSNYRVAFNTIAVVDPIYTLPFLFCMIAIMFINRTKKIRKKLLVIGVGLSSLYLMFTVINKLYINSIYKASLLSNNIEYLRFQTQPSIFNNVLWYGVAETKDNYYVGFYSLLDDSDFVDDWKKLPKNHDLIDVNTKDIKTLSWFSNGYYNFIPLNNNEFRYNDLRYPSFKKNDANASVFSFTIKKEGERWNALPFDGKPPSSEDLNYFWDRIKGKRLH
jgi:inner membrane protein